MSELTKPLVKPRFATSGAAITEPPEFKKDLGWVVEAPPHQFFNWLHKYTYDWLQYLESKQDIDVGAQPTTGLAISGGSVTPTRGVHTIDTEGFAASDDLANIAVDNLDDGRLLLIRTFSDSRDVTLKHSAGGVGQILLRRGVDLVLNESALWVLLIRDGNDWREVFSRPYLQDDPNPTLTADLVAGAAGLDIGTMGLRFAEIYATTSDAITTLTQRVDRRDVGTLDIGNTNADVINIGRAGAEINIYGAVIDIETTNTNVTDKLVTLNKGGTVNSGSGVGHEIEENAIITGYFKTLSDRSGFEAKAPGNANIASLKPGSAVPFIGMIPVGAILATMPHLIGAYNCTATTAADDNGFVQCNGQTIADATSPLNGQAIPNVNNDVFIMGSAGASGVAGGANTKDLSHTHSVTSNVAVANHASHTHQVTSNVSVSDHASHTHSVTSDVTVADHPAHTHSVTSNVSVANHALVAGNIPQLSGNFTSGNQSANHTHSGTTGEQSQGHTHTWSTSASGAHGHGKIKGFIAGHSTLSSTYNEYHPSSAGSYVSITGGVIPNDGSEGTHSHSGTTSNISANHTHAITTGINSANHTHTTTVSLGSASPTAITHAVTNNAVTSGNPSATLTHTATNNAVTSAGPSATLSHSVGNGTVTSGVESATLTHSVTNNAVTSGSALSSSYDVRPKYITAKYIMRIK